MRPFVRWPTCIRFTMARLAGLNFGPYIAGIQILHLLNVLLVWMLVRALKPNRWRLHAIEVTDIVSGRRLVGRSKSMFVVHSQSGWMSMLNLCAADAEVEYDVCGSAAGRSDDVSSQRLCRIGSHVCNSELTCCCRLRLTRAT